MTKAAPNVEDMSDEQVAALAEQIRKRGALRLKEVVDLVDSPEFVAVHEKLTALSGASLPESNTRNNIGHVLTCMNGLRICAREDAANFNPQPADMTDLAASAAPAAAAKSST